MPRKHFWIPFAMLPVGAVFGFIAAAIFTYITPRLYESEAVIEVKPSAHFSLDSFPFSPTRDPDKIQTDDTLARVVEDLDLTSRWNIERNSAIQILKDVLTVESIRGTDLISIRARHTNRMDARDIALGVATTYQKQLDETKDKAVEESIQKWDKAVIQQENLVEQKRKELAASVQNRATDGETDRDRQIMLEKSVDAKRNFESEKALLDQMKIKREGERISGNNSPELVSFHQLPLESIQPVSPNVTLNLVLGTALGIIASIPVSLFILWLLSRPEMTTEPSTPRVRD